jgi:hypothetical protein
VPAEVSVVVIVMAGGSTCMDIMSLFLLLLADIPCQSYFCASFFLSVIAIIRQVMFSMRTLSGRNVALERYSRHMAVASGSRSTNSSGDDCRNLDCRSCGTSDILRSWAEGLASAIAAATAAGPILGRRGGCEVWDMRLCGVDALEREVLVSGEASAISGCVGSMHT